MHPYDSDVYLDSISQNPLDYAGNSLGSKTINFTHTHKTHNMTMPRNILHVLPALRNQRVLDCSSFFGTFCIIFGLSIYFQKKSIR